MLDYPISVLGGGGPIKTVVELDRIFRLIQVPYSVSLDKPGWVLIRVRPCYEMVVRALLTEIADRAFCVGIGYSVEPTLSLVDSLVKRLEWWWEDR